MPRHVHYLMLLGLLVVGFGQLASAQTPAEKTPAEKKLKVFILAGQSNMVGWGDSLKLTDQLRRGDERVLMFEQGQWQPLKPFKKSTRNQARLGATEFTFGPEIAFADALATAWPNEQLGIIKFAVGGTSILTWKPDWSKSDADRVGQGRLGSLYEKLMQKVKQAGQAREIEIAGFLWLQGGGDMKNVAVAKEYLGNLTKLVTAVRNDVGVPDLPFFCGSIRRAGDPEDLSTLVPERVDGRYPAVEWVLKAQWEVQTAIPQAHTVILRDISTYPMNVHYDTAGQLEVGKLFAQAVLDAIQPATIAGRSPRKILTMLGTKGHTGVTADQLATYRRIFDFTDRNGDGQHSPQEFIDNGRYLTREARQGIFRAADANQDGLVSLAEYEDNRIITDEAKAIFAAMDADDNGQLTMGEFTVSGRISDAGLAKTVFEALDTDGSGELVVPEYLRVWGRWARSRPAAQPAQEN